MIEDKIITDDNFRGYTEFKCKILEELK